MSDTCEVCGERPPTQRLQRILGGVQVGSTFVACSKCVPADVITNA